MDQGIQFTIVPNPAFNNVTVSLPFMIYDGELTLKITDIMGKVIHQQKMQTQSTIINLDEVS